MFEEYGHAQTMDIWIIAAINKGGQLQLYQREEISRDQCPAPGTIISGIKIVLNMYIVGSYVVYRVF